MREGFKIILNVTLILGYIVNAGMLLWGAFSSKVSDRMMIQAVGFLVIIVFGELLNMQKEK